MPSKSDSTRAKPSAKSASATAAKKKPATGSSARKPSRVESESDSSDSSDDDDSSDSSSDSDDDLKTTTRRVPFAFLQSAKKETQPTSATSSAAAAASNRNSEEDDERFLNSKELDKRPPVNMYWNRASRLKLKMKQMKEEPSDHGRVAHTNLFVDLHLKVFVKCSSLDNKVLLPSVLDLSTAEAKDVANWTSCFGDKPQSFAVDAMLSSYARFAEIANTVALMIARVSDAVFTQAELYPDGSLHLIFGFSQNRQLKTFDWLSRLMEMIRDNIIESDWQAHCPVFSDEFMETNQFVMPSKTKFRWELEPDKNIMSTLEYMNAPDPWYPHAEPRVMSEIVVTDDTHYICECMTCSTTFESEGLEMDQLCKKCIREAFDEFGRSVTEILDTQQPQTHMCLAWSKGRLCTFGRITSDTIWGTVEVASVNRLHVLKRIVRYSKTMKSTGKMVPLMTPTFRLVKSSSDTMLSLPRRRQRRG